MPERSFLDHFSALEDPRQSWKVVYPLDEVLLVVLCGTLAGAEDFAEIQRWALRKLDPFAACGLSNGAFPRTTPSTMS